MAGNADTDVMTPEQRSRCMSRIKGRNTGPEMVLRKALWAEGFRYRVNYTKVPGRPDMAFPGKRVALFVDGCFWHGCPIHGVSPKNNAEFWRKKIQGTIDRDKRVTAALEALGWTVIRVWEHEIKDDLTDVKLRLVREVSKR